MNLKMPFDYYKDIVAKAVPKLRYDGNSSYADWQSAAKAKLVELLAISETKVPFEYNEISVTNSPIGKDTFFTFQTEEGLYVPCHLFIPITGKNKYPLMICLQGHSKGMFKSYEPGKVDGDRNFASQAVEHGYAALCIEQTCFGTFGGTKEDSSPDCRQSAMIALLMGKTIIGQRLHNIMRAIDLLEEKFDIVNTTDVSCMGNSGGGTATFYLSCVDDRVKNAIVSCAFCSYKDSIVDLYHCECNYIPHIAEYFDMGDLAGLIAPKKLLVVSGTYDPIFPIAGVYKCKAVAQKMFEYAGCADNIVFAEGPGEHRFYADVSWEAFNKLIGK